MGRATGATTNRRERSRPAAARGRFAGRNPSTRTVAFPGAVPTTPSAGTCAQLQDSYHGCRCGCGSEGFGRRSAHAQRVLPKRADFLRGRTREPRPAVERSEVRSQQHRAKRGRECQTPLICPQSCRTRSESRRGHVFSRHRSSSRCGCRATGESGALPGVNRRENARWSAIVRAFASRHRRLCTSPCA